MTLMKKIQMTLMKKITNGDKMFPTPSNNERSNTDEGSRHKNECGPSHLNQNQLLPDA